MIIPRCSATRPRYAFFFFRVLLDSITAVSSLASILSKIAEMTWGCVRDLILFHAKYFPMTEEPTSPEQTLSEIRQLMERSSRFISLSGLSGVMAGVYALAGAAVAYYRLGMNLDNVRVRDDGDLAFMFANAAIVLVLAFATGIFLTTRKAKKDGNSLFDVSAKRLLINLFIPLVAGGVFCLAQIFYGHGFYVAPTMLVFYGLALINASKYTRNDIRSLGVAEMLLGFVSLFMPGYGLFSWAFGFGILHIVYGVYMYFKYEK
jgi:hypothetical protein